MVKKNKRKMMKQMWQNVKKKGELWKMYLRVLLFLQLLCKFDIILNRQKILFFLNF